MPLRCDHCEAVFDADELEDVDYGDRDDLEDVDHDFLDFQEENFGRCPSCGIAAHKSSFNG